MSTSSTSTNWTTGQDAALRAAVVRCGPNNWEEVTRLLHENTGVTRTAQACQLHWQRSLRPSEMMKGAWTEEEDDVIRDMVAIHGTKNWAQIAKILVSRSGKQCRERWFNVLDPHIKRDPFSAKEDERILQEKFRQGPKWAAIAASLPGRTDNAIKNRYNSTLRRVMSYAKKELVSRGVISANADETSCGWELLDELRRKNLLGEGTKKLTMRPQSGSSNGSSKPRNNTRNRGTVKVKSSSNLNSTDGTSETLPKHNSDLKNASRKSTQTNSEPASNTALNERRSARNASRRRRAMTTDSSTENEDYVPSLVVSPSTSLSKRTRRRSKLKTHIDSPPTIRASSGFPSSTANIQATPARHSSTKPSGTLKSDTADFHGVAVLTAAAESIERRLLESRQSDLSDSSASEDDEDDSASRFSAAGCTPLSEFAAHAAASPAIALDGSVSAAYTPAYTTLHAEESELLQTGLKPHAHSSHSMNFGTPSSVQNDQQAQGSSSTGSRSGKGREPTYGFSPELSFLVSPTVRPDLQQRSPSRPISASSSSSAIAGSQPRMGIAHPSRAGSVPAKGTRRRIAINDTDAPAVLPPRPPPPKRAKTIASPSAISARAALAVSLNAGSSETSFSFMSPAEQLFRRSGDAAAAAPIAKREYSWKTPLLSSASGVGSTPAVSVDDDDTKAAAQLLTRTRQTQSSSYSSSYMKDQSTLKTPNTNSTPIRMDVTPLSRGSPTMAPDSAQEAYNFVNAPLNDEQKPSSQRALAQITNSKAYVFTPAPPYSPARSRSSVLSRAGATRSDILQLSPSQSPLRTRGLGSNVSVPRRRLHDTSLAYATNSPGSLRVSQESTTSTP